MNLLRIFLTTIAFVFTLAIAPVLAQTAPDVPAPTADQPVKQVDCDDDDDDDDDDRDDDKDSADCDDDDAT